MIDDPYLTVPLAPLDEYITRLGGLSALPGTGVRYKDDYDRWQVERTREENLHYARARKALFNLRQQGSEANLYMVDAFVCTYLQVHPASVYGPSWFTFGEEIPSIPAHMGSRSQHVEVAA